MNLKKSFTVLVAVMIIGAFSGLCFASEPAADVYDQPYPELGFQSHSWITESGNDTIVHTQIIDTATGTVLKQVDQKCSYDFSVDRSGDD